MLVLRMIHWLQGLVPEVQRDVGGRARLVLGRIHWLPGLVPEVRRDVGGRAWLVLGRICLPQGLGLAVQLGAGDEMAQVALRRSVLQIVTSPRRGVFAMPAVLREKEVVRYWMLMKLELEMMTNRFAGHVNVFGLSVR